MIPVKLSIIIPVYNEEQTIGEVVERVLAVDLGGIEKEIIIANDGSSDGTRDAIAGEPLGRRSAHQDSTKARSTSARAPPSGSG